MFVKSTPFQQVCQLLLSLIVGLLSNRHFLQAWGYLRILNSDSQHSTNTFQSSFSSKRLCGKHSCHFRHSLEANFYVGNFRWIVSRAGVRGKTLNVALKQPMGLRDSTSAILRSTRKYSWARVLDLKEVVICLYYWLTFWNVWPSHVFDDLRSICLLTLGVNSKCVSHTAPSKWPKYSS